jgi:hypothetical protein
MNHFPRHGRDLTLPAYPGREDRAEVMGLCFTFFLENW